jgi:hypothetical protein
MRFLLTAVLVIAVSTLFAPSVTAQQYFQAVINGAQEVPPSGSPATGFACFVLNADNTLDYLVSYNGLTGVEAAAHIHGPAPAGINAAVVFPFAVGSPKIGTFGPLTAAQVADLSGGLYYVNIHSTLFPGGEIRGQILLSGESCATPTEETTWGAVKSLYE